ncbi:MAG: hypothetical protein ACE5D0_00835 [Fidelibacterota bacterium]
MKTFVGKNVEQTFLSVPLQAGMPAVHFCNVIEKHRRKGMSAAQKTVSYYISSVM